MITGNESIYPDPMRGAEQSYSNQSPHELPAGMTYRQWLAGIILAGLSGNSGIGGSPDKYAETAAARADALISQLNMDELKNNQP